jgi:hypothetical protein
MFQNCHHESAANSSFIRDLTDLGAEFSETNWQNEWIDRFDLSIYVYDRDTAGIPMCLPRLMVESMQTVSEFAEGAMAHKYPKQIWTEC